MTVIPRTHPHDGFSDYVPVANPAKKVFPNRDHTGQCDDSKAVDMILQPNECSVHHAKLDPWLSNPNTQCHPALWLHDAVRPGDEQVTGRPYTPKHPPSRFTSPAVGAEGNQYGDPTKINEAWVDAKRPNG